MKKTTLIFDFDGTIADTHHFIIQISNQIAPHFGYKKIEDHEIEELKNKSAQEVIKILQVPLLKIPAIISKAKQVFNEQIDSIEPIAGLKDALEKLQEQGHIQLGILSSNSQENVQTFLENHGMKDIFDFIHTTSKVWSKNSVLKKLMKEYELIKEDVIYVGDETRDIVAAKKVPVAVAAVTWGYNSHKALAKENPTRLIDTPEDLATLAL